MGIACPADRFLPARYLNPFFGVPRMMMVSGCYAYCPGYSGEQPLGLARERAGLLPAKTLRQGVLLYAP